MNQHEKEIYRAGYKQGKSKSKIIRTTLVQRIKSSDEKEWEGKINYFAYAAIICLLLFGITIELYVRNLNNANDITTKLGLAQTAYNQCMDDHSPIITQVDATVYHFENEDLSVLNNTIKFGDPFPIHVDNYWNNFCIRGKCFGIFWPGQYIFIPADKVGEVYTCTNPVEGPGNEIFKWAYYCNIDDFGVRYAQ